jgi:DNA-binding NarL/FixJ family response regulator
MLLAQAWVAAAEGSLREALSLTRQAAGVAAAQHQLAAEVFALHTAVCFGDRSVADRLAELATQVDGPRACAAAAHAAALAADDGPALLAGTAPLPISTREREVATMVATGLSNKDIAARLHVSIRTVEDHIYRACTRLGVTDRTALAALFIEPTAPTASRAAE